MKIIFLDIDGVLYSGRAAVLPANLQLAAQQNDEDGRHSMRDIAEKCEFDPCAIALVNRLCARTGARIVVHSNWRRNVGGELTKRKLIEQGIDQGYLHDDWACPMKFSSSKGHDIHTWLDDHRAKPMPERPEWMDDFDILFGRKKRTKAQEAEAEAFEAARIDYGIQYIVVDDDEICGSSNDVQIRTDFFDGFDVGAYRIALSLLDGEDRQFGVYPLAEEDMSRLMHEFAGARVKAMKWLSETTVYGDTRSRRLNREAGLQSIRALRAFGYDGQEEPEDHVEAVRKCVWEELPLLTKNIISPA